MKFVELGIKARSTCFQAQAGMGGTRQGGWASLNLGFVHKVILGHRRPVCAHAPDGVALTDWVVGLFETPKRDQAGLRSPSRPQVVPAEI